MNQETEYYVNEGDISGGFFNESPTDWGFRFDICRRVFRIVAGQPSAPAGGTVEREFGADETGPVPDEEEPLLGVVAAA